MKLSCAMLKQMTASIGFALPSDSSQHFSEPRSEMQGLSKPRPGLGLQSITSKLQFISMPGTIAWQGMHTSRSRMHPEILQSYHNSALKTSVSIQLSLEQLRSDNGINSFPGSGASVHLSHKMAHGWMSVSDHLCRSIW